MLLITQGGAASAGLFDDEVGGGAAKSLCPNVRTDH